MIMEVRTLQHRICSDCCNQPKKQDRKFGNALYRVVRYKNILEIRLS